MSPSTVIAIDPGSSGAAVIRSVDGPVLDVVKYDGRDSVLHTITRATMSPAGARCVAAVIERVWATPVMGKSACFAFGGNYEGWIMALKARGVAVHCVTPQVWQKVAAPDVQGQGDARKAALKELALARFDLPVSEPLLPKGIRITLTNCDALLLSDYALHQLKAGRPLGEPL